MSSMKVFSSALLAVLVSVSTLNAKAPNETLAKTEAKQEVVTPQSALAELKAGNERFLAKKPINTAYDKQIEATKGGQKPHSAILSCMDSRVPPEILFDQGIGNIFAIRNAGNIEDENVLGSLEYAVKFAGAKLIVIMGHNHCGAVTGAIKDVKSGNLTQLLEQIKPAIPADKNHPNIVDETAKKSVQITIDDIRKKSATIKEMEDKGEIKIVPAFYDLESGKINFL